MDNDAEFEQALAAALARSLDMVTIRTNQPSVESHRPAEPLVESNMRPVESNMRVAESNMRPVESNMPVAESTLSLALSLATVPRARQHIDFVVGRGHAYPRGYLNIPLNPLMATRCVVYIDPNPDMRADVRQYLQDVDFAEYMITPLDDPDGLVEVRFIFDWSSFYCGAMQLLDSIVKRLGRRCQILVPLCDDEPAIPPDVHRGLGKNKLFSLTTVEGMYPLFDWTRPDLCGEVNPHRYMVIRAFEH